MNFVTKKAEKNWTVKKREVTYEKAGKSFKRHTMKVRWKKKEYDIRVLVFSQNSLDYTFVSVTITDKNTKENIFWQSQSCIFLIFLNLKFCLLASLLMRRFRHVLHNVPLSHPLDAPQAKDADAPPPSRPP